MAKVIELIGSLDQNNKEYELFMQDLLLNNADIPFDKDEANTVQNSIISLINTKLNQSKTRHDGLGLLLQILSRCSKDLLSKYAVLWIAKATQTLESNQSDQSQLGIACRVIATLAISCKEIPELQKQISIQNVKQLIAHINNMEEDRRCGPTFYLIAVLLYHYPEPCERLQVSIRKLIVPLVDSKQRNLVRSGANCYALLARATGRSFKPPPTKTSYTAWTYNQALICNSLHETMDAFFSGLTELENVEIWDKLTLQSISEDNVMEYYYGLERRFRNLCVYLATMLGGCGGKNTVSPSTILKVLCRGLAVTPANLGIEDSFKKQILYLLLPKLHTSLLSVLDAFVDGFRKDLVPYALTMLQLLQQTLTWTERVYENSTTLGGCKPFKDLRIAVYKSLSTWLMHAGALSGVELVSDEFLPHILRDITPEKDRVVLTVQKTHNLSKRALKRLRESHYKNSAALGNAEIVTDPCLNADLCREALIALQNIFFSGSCRMKQSFYKSVQNIVIALLYDYYLDTPEQNFYTQKSDCRLNLLKALKSLQINPHGSTPPPTPYSIEIFQMAQLDTELNITQEAKLALAEIEKIVHPSAPTLKLPIVIRENGQENEQNDENDTAMEDVINENAGSGDGSGNSRCQTVWDRFRDDQNVSTVVNYDDNSVLDLNESLTEAESVKGNATSVYSENKSDHEPSPKKQRKDNLPESNGNTDSNKAPAQGTNTNLNSNVSEAGIETNIPSHYSDENPCEIDSMKSQEMNVNLTPDDSKENGKHSSPHSDGNSRENSNPISSGESTKLSSYLTLKEIQRRSPCSAADNSYEDKILNMVADDTLNNTDSIAHKIEGSDTSAMKADCEEVEGSDEETTMLNLFCDEPKDE